MSAIDYLKNYGITAELKEGGKIGLKGIKKLPDEKMAEVLAWAKANRDEILFELNDYCQEGQKQQVPPCPARCNRSGLCYGVAYFDGKPGRGTTCDRSRCAYRDRRPPDALKMN